MSEGSRRTRGAVGEVLRAVVAAVVLANVAAFGLLLTANATGLGSALGVDLRSGAEVRIDASEAELRAILEGLDPALGEASVRDDGVAAIQVRTDDPIAALAAIREAAEARGLEVGLFVLLNPFAAVLDALASGGDEALALVGLLALPMPLVFACVGAWRRRRLDPRPARQPAPGRAALDGLGLGLVAVALGLALDALLASVGFEQEEQAFVTSLVERGGAGLAALVAFAVVAAPVGEELFFRGYALERLQRALRPGVAVLASSALFALLHLNPTALPHYLLIGCLFAWSYRRSGGLVAPTVAHGVHNGLVLALAL